MILFSSLSPPQRGFLAEGNGVDSGGGESEEKRIILLNRL